MTDTSVLGLVKITKTEKWEDESVTPYQPDAWTAIRFEGEESRLNNFLERLSKSLKPKAWYVTIKFRDKEYVIFPDKVFSYIIGDIETKNKAKDFARSIEVPESQLDW